MAGRRRGGAPRPPHTRHRTARPAGATPLPPAPPPPPGPPLAPAVPQPAGRTREPTEEQVHCLRDPRVLPGDAEIGEDEQAPVRRDVLGPVQFERRGAGRVRLAPGMLLAKELRSPPPLICSRTGLERGGTGGKRFWGGEPFRRRVPP